MAENAIPPAAPTSPSSPPPAKIRRKLIYNLSRLKLVRKIREAARLMECGERELAFYLLDLKRRKFYIDRDCVSFAEFIRKRTGLRPKKARELVRVAAALEHLPASDDAFSRGEIYWSAVRSYTSIANPDTDLSWVRYAKTHTVAEVERRVASMKKGESPWRPRWKGRPVRFPHNLNAAPELHQAIESWCSVMDREAGGEISEE